MKYEDALKLWGATKVADCYRLEVEEFDLAEVTVNFAFDAGFACCGGRDPECYCSFAESPSADVVVTARKKGGGYLRWTLDLESFDFATVLAEVCEAGEGTISA